MLPVCLASPHSRSSQWDSPVESRHASENANRVAITVSGHPDRSPALRAPPWLEPHSAPYRYLRPSPSVWWHRAPSWFVHVGPISANSSWRQATRVDLRTPGRLAMTCRCCGRDDTLYRWLIARGSDYARLVCEECHQGAADGDANVWSFYWHDTPDPDDDRTWRAVDPDDVASKREAHATSQADLDTRSRSSRRSLDELADKNRSLFPTRSRPGRTPPAEAHPPAARPTAPRPVYKSPSRPIDPTRVESEQDAPPSTTTGGDDDRSLARRLRSWASTAARDVAEWLEP